MALPQNRKNSALRVCFLTDSRFDEENRRANGALKKRALRQIQRIVRYPVVESANFPDVCFRVYRVGDGSKQWMLRKENA
jgi:hypothetical protein